ncbi:MAG: phosphate/phosphite/phosphonate ABC transporter substrate-binding protein [Paracoccaceae bacterium]
MIATLPMYDRPETAAAHDAYWRAIRARLGHGPEALRRDGDPWAAWRAPDLLLAQTCGLPFRSRLHGSVALVGTPDFGLEGCAPGYYRSIFVARADDPGELADFAGRRFACNDPLSQSGWAAPAIHFSDAGLEFGPLLWTGGHAASARAVAEGRADLAAIDAMSWRLIRRHDAFAARLREVAATLPTPGLPYITADAGLVAPLGQAIASAISDLPERHRAALCLQGLVTIPEAAYLAVPMPPEVAHPA